MKSLIHSFLESLAETISTLNYEPNSNFFNPSVAILSALILTGIASFSFEPKLPLLILAVSVMLMILTHSRVYSWIKITLLITLWAVAVSIPLLFITPGDLIISIPLKLVELKISREGLNAMMVFTIRVVAAGAIFTAFIFILGWRKTMEGLRGLQIPRDVVFLLTLSIIYIPFLLREAAKILSAREARIVRRVKFREVWYVLASVIGDLLLKSYEHAWRLEKAIRARSFTLTRSSLGPPAKIGVKDLTLLTFTFCTLALRFLAWL